MLDFVDCIRVLDSEIELLQIEGGVKVCGDAVLRYFWRGFAEIFILTCGLRCEESLGHGYR